MLEAQSFGSNDERSAATQTCKHYLTAGSHVVGRQIGQCAIVVEEDKSISRSHAVVTVSYDSAGLCNVKGEHRRTAPSLHLCCDSLQDLDKTCLSADNSRYGTLINKKELNGGLQELREGDVLQFGHKSVFR